MTRPDGSSLAREAPRATDGYEPAWFSADVGGVSVGHWVYRGARAGPAVIVIHEAAGLTRRTVGVATRIQAGGMTPILPLLAGEVMPSAVGRLRAFAQVCVKREFGALANGEATPTAAWLRSLAQHESTESGGLGVGVIGMCLSGGYALAMAIDPSVKAVVSSQPAFPVALGSRRRQFGVNSGDVAALTGEHRRRPVREDASLPAGFHLASCPARSHPRGAPQRDPRRDPNLEPVRSSGALRRGRGCTGHAAWPCADRYGRLPAGPSRDRCRGCRSRYSVMTTTGHRCAPSGWATSFGYRSAGRRTT